MEQHEITLGTGDYVQMKIAQKNCPIKMQIM